MLFWFFRSPHNIKLIMKARIIGTDTIIDVAPYFSSSKVMIGYGEKVVGRSGNTEVLRYWPPSALQVIDPYSNIRGLKLQAASVYMAINCGNQTVANKHQYEILALKAIDAANALVDVLIRRDEQNI